MGIPQKKKNVSLSYELVLKNRFKVTDNFKKKACYQFESVFIHLYL